MEEKIKMSTEVGIKDPALNPTDPPGDEPLSDRVPVSVQAPVRIT